MGLSEVAELRAWLSRDGKTARMIISGGKTALRVICARKGHPRFSGVLKTMSPSYTAFVMTCEKRSVFSLRDAGVISERL